MARFAHGALDPWWLHFKSAPLRNGAFDGVGGASQGIEVP